MDDLVVRRLAAGTTDTQYSGAAETMAGT